MLTRLNLPSWVIASGITIVAVLVLGWALALPRGADVPAPGSPSPTANVPAPGSPSPSYPVPVAVDADALRATVVQEALRNPWDLAFAPDGTMFVTERPGRIRVYENGLPGAELLHTAEVPDVRQEREAGLMGIAIDSHFAEHPFIYVCASRDPDGEGPELWANNLLKYRVEDDFRLALDSVFLEDVMGAWIFHNGCALQMDLNRVLWLTMGDKDYYPNPQDPNILNGKVLRINADGSVPDDNPVWPGMTEPTYVFTLGHRNPQGIAFDPSSGDPYMTEHGTDIEDEINRLVAGGNYGWPCVLGPNRPNPKPFEGCPAGGEYRTPAWSSGDATIATSGAVFLTGHIWGTWEGSLIVATLKEMELRRFVIDGGSLIQADILFDEEFGRLRAAVLAPDGGLYTTTSNSTDVDSDVVIRIEPPALGT